MGSGRKPEELDGDGLDMAVGGAAKADAGDVKMEEHQKQRSERHNNGGLSAASAEEHRKDR